MLDIGVRILRRHWAALLVVALLFTGPGALLGSAAGLRFTEVAQGVFPDLEEGVIDPAAVISDTELRLVLEALVPFLLASLVAGMLASIGALGFSACVAGDYHARAVELGPVLRACLRRAPSVLVFMVVTGLMVVGIAVLGLLAVAAVTIIVPTGAVGAGGPGIFLALVVAVAVAFSLVYLTMRWAPAYPAMIEEDIGWRDALRRSWHLSADNVLRIFALLAVAAIATLLLNTILSVLLDGVLAGALAPTLGLDAQVASTVALAISSVIVAPVMPVLTAVLYYDLRTRRDLPEEQPTRNDSSSGGGLS